MDILQICNILEQGGLSDESLRNLIPDLIKNIRILVKKSESSLANNLCPDHRDKQTGKSCLACEIETLTRRLNNEHSRTTS